MISLLTSDDYAMMLDHLRAEVAQLRAENILLQQLLIQLGVSDESESECVGSDRALDDTNIRVGGTD